MKKLVLLTITGVLGAALAAGQTPAPDPKTAPGKGRGGAPHAWNDKNKDGICDVTGKPVGQGRVMAGKQQGKQGRGHRHGRGMQRGFAAQPAPAAAPQQ